MAGAPVLHRFAQRFMVLTMLGDVPPQAVAFARYVAFVV
jgi:hypothetical protein